MQQPSAISENLVNRLDRYLQEHPDESLSSLLEEILQQKENPGDKTPRFLRIKPAPKGSGYKNTSIDHDRVLAETMEECD